MKKLLVFMAMMTLALGAWAYEYIFTLTVQCPTEFKNMSDNGGYYLVNTKSKTVYSYWLGSEWSVNEQDGTLFLATETKHNAVSDNSFSVKGTTIDGYNVIDQLYKKTESSVKNAESSIEGYKRVTFEHGFASDVALTKAVLGKLDDDEYREDLAVIVFDSELGINESYKVGTTGNLTNNEIVHFTAAGTMTPVPEPTSGMLFLLGLAGLSLRRRRVA